MAVDLVVGGQRIGSLACSGSSIVVRDAAGAAIGQVGDLRAALALLTLRQAA